MKLLNNKYVGGKVKTKIYKQKYFMEVDKNSYRTHLAILREKLRLKRDKNEK